MATIILSAAVDLDLLLQKEVIFLVWLQSFLSQNFNCQKEQRQTKKTVICNLYLKGISKDIQKKIYKTIAIFFLAIQQVQSNKLIAALFF